MGDRTINTAHPPTPVMRRDSSSSIQKHGIDDSKWTRKDPEDTPNSAIPYGDANRPSKSLLSRVLEQRELQSADQLFNASDYEIITELYSAVEPIKRIFNEPTYATNANDQSIIELVLSRLTTAIRVTCCIESYAPALVDILDSSLLHLMHTQTIQDSKNYSLVRVIPLVYPENREPFHAYLTPLFNLLHCSATDVSEKLSLLHLASMITNHKPDLILPHLAKFDDFLMSHTTCTAVLHIYLSLISMNRVSALIGRLQPLRQAAKNSPTQNNLVTMGKIIGCIGRSTKESLMAGIAVEDLIGLLMKCNTQNLPIVLKEIEGIAEVYPSVLESHMQSLERLCEQSPSMYSACARIRTLCSESHRKRDSRIGGLLDDGTTSDNTTGEHSANERLLSTRGIFDNAFIESAESLRSKQSLNALPNDPAPAKTSNAPAHVTSFGSGYPKHSYGKATWNTDNKSAGELELLDRNMETLALKMRSSGSLGNPKSRSILSLINSAQSQHSFHNHDNASRYSVVNEVLHEDSPYSNPREATAHNTYKTDAGIPNATQTLEREPRPSRQHRHPIIQREQVSNPIQMQNAKNLQTPPEPVNPAPQIMDNDRRNALLQLEYGTILQQILPSPYPNAKSDERPCTLFATPVQIGKDGRVRPISMHKRGNQNFLNWTGAAHSESSLPSYEETVFPVNASASVVRTTKNSRTHTDEMATSMVSSSGGHADPTNAANKYSRPHSTDPSTHQPRSSSVGSAKVEAIPVRCTIEGTKGAKSRMIVHFACQANGQYCVYSRLQNLFAFKTHIPSVWLHLMFLQCGVWKLPELCSASNLRNIGLWRIAGPVYPKK
ncbi:protein melted like protein [Ditylenchus destructor]|nr:protein melted like protein [Ditylenchus destructor]